MAKPKKWRIDERGSPSTRAYLALVRRYHRERSVYARKVLKALIDANPVPTATTPQRIALALADGGPEAPSPTTIAAANSAAAKQSARLARRDLLKAGASPALLEAAGIPASAGELTSIDIILGGVEKESLEQWARAGTDLIKNISPDRSGTLEARLAERVAAGDRWESIQSVVTEELGAEWPRLQLIARDQVAKLNGKITQDLQTAAGVTHFTWRASRDGRVRPSHDAVKDKQWSWARGAPDVGFYGEDGFPGQAGQCRCTAEPVMPESLRADSVSVWYALSRRGRIAP